VRSDPPCSLVAVDVGQLDVEDHEVRPKAYGGRDALLAGGRLADGLET
jgi:hypothetical protein